MARHKYSLLVALGVVSADQTADAAFKNWVEKIGKIHAPTSAECAGKISIAHLRCVLKGLIENSANLIRAELGPVAAEIRTYLQPLVQAKLGAIAR